jgi:membrane protein implicated in regulation of membrane protease activity
MNERPQAGISLLSGLRWSLHGVMTNGTRSESETTFIVAAVVLLGLPFIVLIGMAGLVIAATAGLIPGARNGLSGDTTWVLLLFFVVWAVVAVVAVLIFVVRLLRRTSHQPPH